MNEMENTGYEERLKEIENLDEKEWETPKSNFDIDVFWNKTMTEGDELIGVFLERRKFTSDGEDFYGILIQTSAGIYSITENKFLKQRLETINEGDGIKIRYLGKKPVKNGKGQYNNYNVHIKRYSPENKKKMESQSQIAPFNPDNYDNSNIKAIHDILRSEGEPVTIETIIDRAEEIHAADRLTDQELMKIKKDLGRG
jgi:hypothetical protein